MKCAHCQSEMQSKWAFHHPLWLVIPGAALLLFSLALGVAGVYGLHEGLANVRHREGPDIGAFGGLVLSGISMLGLITGGFLIRWRRAWRCGSCGL